MYNKYIITGCAGFIGSNLINRLLQNPSNLVIGIDNFSTGKRNYIKNSLKNKNFFFYETDLLNLSKLKTLISKGNIIIHLAANADVRHGPVNTKKDLEQNTIATYNVLEAMRFNKVNKIIFSSTGSVYGETNKIPTPENAPFPIQTSLYGASKIACEGLITAYCEAFNMQSIIFRFVSILGENYNHGHVYDFYKQLIYDRKKLTILGNGKQRKSYLYVEDCIDAILLALNKCDNKVNIFNLGTNEYCDVNSSAKLICDILKLKPKLKFTGGKRGWIGDNPFIYLDTKKIRSLGWKPKLNIKDSIIKTVHFLKNNEWLFNEKK
jgi:UDP-glucose 4-epimerase